MPQVAWGGQKVKTKKAGSMGVPPGYTPPTPGGVMGVPPGYTPPAGGQPPPAQPTLGQPAGGGTNWWDKVANLNPMDWLARTVLPAFPGLGGAYNLASTVPRFREEVSNLFPQVRGVGESLLTAGGWLPPTEGGEPAAPPPIPKTPEELLILPQLIEEGYQDSYLIDVLGYTQAEIDQARGAKGTPANALPEAQIFGTPEEADAAAPEGWVPYALSGDYTGLYGIRRVQETPWAEQLARQQWEQNPRNWVQYALQQGQTPALRGFMEPMMQQAQAGAPLSSEMQMRPISGQYWGNLSPRQQEEIYGLAQYLGTTPGELQSQMQRQGPPAGSYQGLQYRR